MFSIKTLDDRIGKGIQIDDNGLIYEARTKSSFQTRLYGKENGGFTAIVRIPTVNGSEYQQFKTLTDRLNSAFDVNIGNRKQNFVEYLYSGFECEEDDLQFKVNLKSEDSKKVINYSAVSRPAICAGLANAATFWSILSYGLLTNPVPPAAGLVSTFYMVMSCAIGIVGAMISSDVEGITHIVSPFEFAVAYYPMRLRKQEKILSEEGLTELANLMEKYKKLEKKYESKLAIKKLKKIKPKLMDARSKVDDCWDAVSAAHFKEFEQQQGIFAIYKAEFYDDAYKFLNYMINGGHYSAPAQLPDQPKTDTDERRKEIEQVVREEMQKEGVVPTYGKVKVVDLEKIPEEGIRMEAKP